MAIDFSVELVGEIQNPKDHNIDVFIRFKNGEEYVASFFTLQNITKLISKNRISGEQLNGLYFWASDMIIIEEINEDNIRLAINDLIKSHGFYLAVSATNDIARKRIIEETKIHGIGEVLNPPIVISKKKI